MRVATYNLYLGAAVELLFGVSDLDQLTAAVDTVRAQLAATSFDERAEAVARVLSRQRPDLVGLQEVSRWTEGAETVADFLPTLRAALEAAGCGYDVHAVNENFTGAMPVPGGEVVGLTGANATLVRRGAGLEVVAERTASYARSLEVSTGIEGLAFPVVRSWGAVDVRVAGAADAPTVRFANTHLETYDAATREAQRDELLAAAADAAGPVVVVGDLNAEPHEVGMPPGWLDAWSAGEGDGFSSGQAADLANEESGLHHRIDYVWVRGAGVSASWLAGHRPEDRTAVHRLWPSDHACVLADLDLPAAGPR